MPRALADLTLGRRTLLAGVGGLAAAVSGCSRVGSGTDAEFTITIGHPSPPDHFHIATLENLKKQIESGSAGRIAVRVYPNGVFGGDREVIEAVQLNNLQIGVPPASSLAAFVPSMNVWDDPYLFDGREHAYRTLDGDYGQSLLRKVEDYNLVARGYWDNGFRNLTTGRTRVEDEGDMRGLSIRTLENTAHIRAWQAVGANPTPMAFGEVYVGLQQGTISAQENSMSNISTQRFYEVQNYLVETEHLYGPSPLLINQDFYESLPEDLRDVVDEAAVDAVTYCREAGAAADEVSLAVIEDAGVEIVPLEDRPRQEIRAAMQEGAESYLRGVVGQDELDALHDAVEEAR
jgi:TRAP-type transport system periplasmic protein